MHTLQFTARSLRLHALLAFATCALMASCSPTETTEITSLEDMERARIGVTSGAVTAQLAYERFPEAKISEFGDSTDIIGALKAGHIDATLTAESTALLTVRNNPTLKLLPTSLREDPTCAGIRKGNDELRSQVNAIIADLKADGTLEDMQRRWFKTTPGPYETRSYPPGRSGPPLRVGVAATREPMSFVDAGGNITGHDGELAKLFASRLDRPIVFMDARWDSLIPALEAGKIDMIVTGMSYTEERAKRIDFTDGYYSNRIVIMVADRSETTPAAEAGLNLSSTADLAEQSIAILQGSAFDVFAQEKYPKAELQFYNSVADTIAAVEAEKAVAGLADEDTLRQFLKSNPSLKTLGEPIFASDVAAAFRQDGDALRSQFNAFLAEIRANGTYDDIRRRWIEEEQFVMPNLPQNPDAPPLYIGNAIIGLPQVALLNGELAGFDVEIALRFGQWANRKVEFVTVDWAALIPGLIGGKIDTIVSSMFITPERRERVDFSEPYYEALSFAFTLSKNQAGGSQPSSVIEPVGFWASTARSFEDNIIREKRYLLLWDGLLTTMELSILSTLLGTVLGGMVCAMRMSPRGTLRIPAVIYIELMRGLPVLVLLMLIFYVLFASVDISPVLVAVVAFGLHFAAYAAEIFRTGIRSIDSGQTEAGIAMGFTNVQTFIHIILPQTVQRILPVYKGEFISMVKMTSIVGYVAVHDLTKASDIIRSRTFDAFFPLIMVAILYFLLAWLLTQILEYVERRTDPERRRKAKA